MTRYLIRRLAYLLPVWLGISFVAFALATGWTETALRAALQRRLDSAFVPRTIVFVEKLPRNATGKITERAMQDIAARHLAGDASGN